MVPSTAIDQKSRLALNRRDGSNTTPTLNCSASSGPKLTFPPDRVSGKIASQPGIAGLTVPCGQRVGSTRLLPGFGEMVVPLKIWLKVGTRKPVL